MSKKELISKEVNDFYNKASENERLQYGLGPLEWERNTDIISRYLMPDDKILDIGGGPGAYAEWFANLGHEVHLVDPVANHITQANKRNQKLNNPFKTYLAEAQNLPFEDNLFDLSILHGPLYHLQNETERINALKEAKRTTKIRGTVLCYGINETASSIVALIQGLLTDDNIRNMCLEELETGIHNAPSDKPGMLTGAFYHSPIKMKNEILAVGLTIKAILAVEGSIWLDKNYFSDMGKASSKIKLMDFLKKTENHEAMLSLSPHFVVIAENLV